MVDDLFPRAIEAAAICDRGCNRIWSRLQLYMIEAATVCTRRLLVGDELGDALGLPFVPRARARARRSLRVLRAYGRLCEHWLLGRPAGSKHPRLLLLPGSQPPAPPVARLRVQGEPPGVRVAPAPRGGQRRLLYMAGTPVPAQCWSIVASVNTLLVC